MVHKIVVADGDGIGPEIMAATLDVLQASGAELDIVKIQVGEQQFKAGHSSGIPDPAWDILRDRGVFLKAPITTPQGGGYKSLNVTVRKTLGLFANIRPCISYPSVVSTKHPDMDLVIIRENEEDLYGGIEHRQTTDVYQCLKLISRPGCERIVRYAFEFAKAHKRRKVTCFTKDNIMKLTDGLFHQVFRDIAAEYPDIESDHLIIDIATARLADTPEIFDVIVTLNLYGDIVSDVAAQLSGSVGLGCSANIGASFAMFEAIHGSAPTIAGQNVANPSGLLLAAVQMLVHLGDQKNAEKIQNAWLKTIEDGILTGDLASPKAGNKPVGTKEFGEEVTRRLGSKPTVLIPVNFASAEAKPNVQAKARPSVEKTLVGIDFFCEWPGESGDELATMLQDGAAKTTLGQKGEPLSLTVITNRGVKVWPNGLPETYCTDHWRCRFKKQGISQQDLIDLLDHLSKSGLDFIKVENLYEFDGERGFSLAQGE